MRDRIMKQKIVLATGNKGKVKEMADVLADFGFEVIAQTDLGIESPEETGLTFVENAILKARYASEKSGLPAIADDSGLVVDALNGAPGLYSARYAGHHGDDNANNEKLIQELQGQADRTAHYVCALALVYPDGREVTAEGYCDGLVQDEPKGDNGFGYDPYFHVPQFEKTVAELTIEEKETISHRGRALRELISKL